MTISKLWAKNITYLVDVLVILMAATSLLAL
jgi:hypothetical protein